MTTATQRRAPRAVRFDWSALLAAAFVLLVVAPALHAQHQQFSPQTLAPLYAALMPVASPASAATPAAARAVESALAALECAPRSKTSGIQTPQLRAADGSLAPDGSHRSVTYSQPSTTLPHILAAPRIHTSHVVLSSALTAHEAGYRSGQRNNRSHE